MKYVRSFLLITLGVSIVLSGCDTISHMKTNEDPIKNDEIIEDESSFLTSEIFPDGSDKTEKVVSSWDEYFASDEPLIAAISEKNIFLYGKNSHGQVSDEVILHWDNENYHFNWTYLTPRGIFPKMLLTDFEADGKEELAIVLYNNSGTGVAIEELHIVEKMDGKIKDHVFTSDDYLSQLRRAVRFKSFFKENELMGEFSIGDETYSVSLKDYQESEYGKVSETLYMGAIVFFSFQDHQLKAKFGVGLTFEKFFPSIDIGDLHADVEFAHGKFNLKNVRFEDY